MLRRKLPDCLILCDNERRTLIKHGNKLGARIKEIISIVSYSTCRRWIRQMEESTEERPKKAAKLGRSWIEESINEAIIRIRKETGWGYTKVRPSYAVLRPPHLETNGEECTGRGRVRPPTA